MKRIFYVLLGAILPIAAAATTAVAQETVHPSGVNVDSRYAVSDAAIALGDTLTIVRTLTNNESYPLTGIFLTDNLPVEFSVVSATISIDGVPVNYLSDGPSASPVLSGYNSCRWTIDSPDSAEQLSRPLNPGEELEARFQVVSNDIGRFALPLHATVMYGNATGIFATDASDTVWVQISLDVNDPGDNGSLPGTFQLVSAFPNPFNAEVSIAYKGTGLAAQPIRLEIYNTAGRLVASQSSRSLTDEGVLHWAPDLATGSGVYLYRLTIGEAEAGGKLVLLK